MSVINTNTLSLGSQNNLRRSQAALGSAIERLSSGLRINSARDDAAGQVIANRMTAQIRGMTQAARNANDGISLVQTAEGSLKEINTNLQRIRELAVQAANDTNTVWDRKSIQYEIGQRRIEIDRIAKSMSFNGTALLDGSVKTLNFQVDAGTDSERDVIALDEASLLDATVDGLGLTDLSVTKKGFVMEPKLDENGQPVIDPWDGNVVMEKIDGIFGKSTNEIHAEVIEKVDAALNKIDTARSNLGAVQNRFESTINNLNNTINNLSASRSRIEDADYAVEVSNMTRAQILQQAGTSVLAQANQVPQTVLPLLR